MRMMILITIFLTCSCSNSSQVVLPNFKIGDCFKDKSDLNKPLSEKGVFVYKVLEIENKPRSFSWLSNDPNYGNYVTDTIYQASDNKLHSIREIPSFEHDQHRAKILCPKYGE